MVGESAAACPADAGMVAGSAAGASLRAFVEIVRRGDRLPAAPLFLDEGWYVPTPLEESY